MEVLNSTGNDEQKFSSLDHGWRDLAEKVGHSSTQCRA